MWMHILHSHGNEVEVIPSWGMEHDLSLVAVIV